MISPGLLRPVGFGLTICSAGGFAPMGEGEDKLRESALIGYLIVAARVPVGILAIVVVTLFFIWWLVLEFAIAMIAFPFAAVFANHRWIRESWLGQFPMSLREFSRDGFKY